MYIFNNYDKLYDGVLEINVMFVFRINRFLSILLI